MAFLRKCSSNFFWTPDIKKSPKCCWNNFLTFVTNFMRKFEANVSCFELIGFTIASNIFEKLICLLISMKINGRPSIDSRHMNYALINWIADGDSLFGFIYFFFKLFFLDKSRNFHFFISFIRNWIQDVHQIIVTMMN